MSTVDTQTPVVFNSVPSPCSEDCNKPAHVVLTTIAGITGNSDECFDCWTPNPVNSVIVHYSLGPTGGIHYIELNYSLHPSTKDDKGQSTGKGENRTKFCGLKRDGAKSLPLVFGEPGETVEAKPVTISFSVRNEKLCQMSLTVDEDNALVIQQPEHPTYPINKVPNSVNNVTFYGFKGYFRDNKIIGLGAYYIRSV